MYIDEDDEAFLDDNYFTFYDYLLRVLECFEPNDESMDHYLFHVPVYWDLHANDYIEYCKENHYYYENLHHSFR